MSNDLDMPIDDNIQPRSMAADGVHQIAFDLIRRFVATPSNILDLGSGEGAFARALAQDGHKIVALDMDDSKIKTPEIELRICDLNSNFAELLVTEIGRFDAIIAIEVIEHLENPFAFIRECRKLVKKDGILLLTTPNVEAVNSRILYMYTGRMVSFGDIETVPTGHITPIFSWKAEYILKESGWDIIYWGYNQISYKLGSGLKGVIGGLLVRTFQHLVKGKQGGENLIIVAKAAATNQISGK